MKLFEISQKLKGKLTGNGEIEILRVANLETADEKEIAFVEKFAEPKFANLINQTKASGLIVPENFSLTVSCAVIKVKNPKLAFARIAAELHPPKRCKALTHSSAIISESARFGKNLFIGAFCYVGENTEIGDGTQLHTGAKVGDNVKIGKNCVLHPNVFIADNSEIGDNVILHAGAIIGADGFGYVRDGANGYEKFPQIGKVIIENDVEIGANSCVDRGALGTTRIGAGTKIDNLVQIAHNVEIGKRVIIAALTGISGSSVIGDDVVLAGQVGIADHVRIEAGAIIGAKSAVFPGKIVRKGVWCGIPVQKMDDFKTQTALNKMLPKLRADVQELKKLLS